MGAPTLYLNQRDGTFVPSSSSVFPDSAERDNHGSAWVDLDNDGAVDFVQVVGGANGLAENSEQTSNRVYLNRNGILVDVTTSSGLNMPVARGYQVEFLDADNNGLLDAFLVNEDRFDGQSTSALMMMTGSGWQALDLSEIALLKGLKSIQSEDLNADLLPDLLYRTGGDQLGILLATGNAAAPFKDGSRLLSGIQFASSLRDVATGDFNGDGFTDLIAVTSGAVDSLLLYNPVTQQFNDVSISGGMQYTW